jgi:tRNA (guanine37-N1)-methyltransferase
MFACLEQGITGRALQNNLLTLAYFNPRDFSQNKHNRVDDKPYGGGPGMIMQAEPLLAALTAAKKAAPAPPKVIYLSPQGKTFNHPAALNLCTNNSLIFIAGRYEGIDERIIKLAVDEEWSIGDYILSGGELGAMVMIDALTRLLPGALGHEDSAAEDSFSDGLLKYPQYSRPDCFNDIAVPEILLSGNHQTIASWRLQQSLGRTWQKRPDLLAKKTLTAIETALLTDFIAQQKKK